MAVALETLSGGSGRRDAKEEEFTDEEEVMGLGEYGYNDSEEDDEEEEEAAKGWGSSEKNSWRRK
ncbi:hypothetical protein FN846DRAFT_911067 [Sphaerosporella brunnea]|uniref:Uncharacterized protein n=1 Tax=Sphaerosporella brunnea TaxID=1250544 RepID=A0A5J5ELG6_9PEZI|nr:hypothetical protein FN846DRAFT_911067 [Sphaerosporella brunnea]